MNNHAQVVLAFALAMGHAAGASADALSESQLPFPWTFPRADLAALLAKLKAKDLGRGRKA